MKNKFFIINLFSVLFLFVSSSSFAFTDYTNSERIIRENKQFIDFINVSVTNLAEDQADAFRNIYQMHFNADLAYMQGDYKTTYNKVYASQKELASLCHTMLKEKYLEESKNILSAISLVVAKSKNSRARNFLTLGYRDITRATEAFTIGDGSYRKHYSYKIFKYEEGIQLVRRAQRFGLFALFESLNPDGKRAVYNEIVRQEAAEGRGYFYSRFLDKEGEAFEAEIYISYDDAKKRREEANSDGQAKIVERKLDRHIRFKKESKVAELIHNDYFETAEDIFRQYIPDFNFKLLEALLVVLGGDSDNKNAPKLDYAYMRVRHIDNYGRLAKDSVLDSFLDNVTIDSTNGTPLAPAPDENERKQGDSGTAE